MIASCQSNSGGNTTGTDKQTSVDSLAIKTGAELYPIYCAGCHGRQFQGSSGPALVNTTFKHGNDFGSIRRSIYEGVPSTEMIAYSNLLSDEQIDQITPYIIEAGKSPELIVEDSMPSRVKTLHYELEIEQMVSEGLERPRAFEFLNADSALVTFSKGGLHWLAGGKVDPQAIHIDYDRNRKSDVFGTLYGLLVHYYQQSLSGSYLNGMLEKSVDVKQIKIFDSTTFTLFVDIFTGAGRNKITGRKKGGIKAHTLLSLHSLIPEVVWMSAASKNDKDFLGQLKPQEGEVYIFDKGYVNYSYYHDWTEKGVFYVRRLNDNERYEVVSEEKILERDAEITGVLKDQIVTLKSEKGTLSARLVSFKSLANGKVYTFLSNMFDVTATTIARLYKNRWEIDRTADAALL